MNVHLMAQAVNTTLLSLLAVSPEVLWTGLHTPVRGADCPGRRELDVTHGPDCPTTTGVGAAPRGYHGVHCADTTDVKALFLFYQLLEALRVLHGLGMYHGTLSPATISLTPELWVQLSLGDISVANVPRPVHQTPIHQRWIAGDVTNLEYLLAVNHAAGRTLADPTHHPIVPWVTDFTSPFGGWRDLTKTKFRMHKGDAQLDVTYCSSGVPHHIPEPPLSDLTYFVYTARRVPMDILRSQVRHEFRAAEYPSSMARMYSWSPDECIPEFFTDASVFTSVHGDHGLHDLEVPEWCDSPASFIAYHRQVLESDTVSSTLHTWLDLVFGVLLGGQGAIEHRNVPLPSCHASSHTAPHATGFRQVFNRPHPPRRVSKATVAGSAARSAGTSGDGYSVDTGFVLAPPGLLLLDVSDLAPAPSLSPSPASLSLEPTYAPDTVLYPNGSLQQAQGLDVLAAGNIVAEMFLGRSLELGRPLELSSLSPPLRALLNTILSRGKFGSITAAEALAIGLTGGPQTSLSSPSLPPRYSLLPLTPSSPPPLFPPYFPALHAALRPLASAPTCLDAALSACVCVGDVLALPLPALLLALPHFLSPLAPGDPAAQLAGLPLWTTLADALPEHLMVMRLLPPLLSLYDSVRFGQGGANLLPLACALASADFVIAVHAKLRSERFVHCILPMLMDWTLSCGAPPPVRMEAVHTLACLCHPTSLGPVLTSRFVLPRLLQDAGRLPEDTSLPSPSLAALLAVSRRVSLTLLESLTLPRLLFIITGLSKQCGTGSGRRRSSEASPLIPPEQTGHRDIFQPPQGAEIAAVPLSPKQLALLRDCVSTVSGLVSCLPPSTVKSKLLSSPFPLLSLLPAAVSSLPSASSTTFEPNDPAWLWADVANAVARCVSAAILSSQTDTVKGLVLPTLITVVKRLNRPPDARLVATTCADVIRLLDAFQGRFRCLPLDLVGILQRLLSHCSDPSLLPPATSFLPSPSTPHTRGFWRAEFGDCPPWASLVSYGAQPCSVVYDAHSGATGRDAVGDDDPVLPQAHVLDECVAPVGKRGEWMWGAGMCGPSPWWALVSDNGEATGTLSLPTSPAAGTPHHQQSLTLPRHGVKPITSSALAGLLEASGQDGIMLDPMLADALHKGDRKGEGGERKGEGEKKAEERRGDGTPPRSQTLSPGHEHARRSLRPGMTAEVASAGAGGKADGLPVKPLPASGEVVFVPQLDEGPSFLTPWIDVERGRSGTTWRWKCPDAVSVDDVGGVDDVPSGEKTSRHPVLQCVSRSSGSSTSDIRCIAVDSGCERVFASGGAGGKVNFWGMDVESSSSVGTSGGDPRPLSTLTTLHHHTSSLLFSPCSTRLSIMGDGLSQWDILTQKCLLSHSPSSTPVSLCPTALCQTGRGEDAGKPSPCALLLLATRAGLSLLDARVGVGAACVVGEYRPAGDFGELSSAAVEGYEAFSGSTTGAASILDLRMGRTLHSWQASEVPVSNVFPLPLGQLLLLADKTASLWSPRSWRVRSPSPRLSFSSSSLPPSSSTFPPPPLPSSAPPLHPRGPPSFFTPPRRAAASSRASVEDSDESEVVSISSSVAMHRNRRASSSVSFSVPSSASSTSALTSPLPAVTSVSAFLSEKKQPKPAVRTPLSRAGIEPLVEEGAGVDEDTRTPSSGRWDGILTSAACLWRPFGTQGPTQLLSAEGNSIGVSIIKANARVGGTRSFHLIDVDGSGGSLVGLHIKCLRPLPLRRLLLLGADDGTLRIAAALQP